MEYDITGYEGFRKGIQNQKNPFFTMSFDDALCDDALFDDALCDDALCDSNLEMMPVMMPCDNVLLRCLV